MKIQEPLVKIGSQLTSSATVLGFSNLKNVGPRALVHLNGRTEELELSEVEAIFNSLKKSK